MPRHLWLQQIQQRQRNLRASMACGQLELGSHIAVARGAPPPSLTQGARFSYGARLQVEGGRRALRGCVAEQMIPNEQQAAQWQRAPNVSKPIQAFLDFLSDAVSRQVLKTFCWCTLCKSGRSRQI